MINWLKARLNRDNFCNIMFWLGMTLSAGVVDTLVNFIPILAVLSFILTFSLVPYLLTRANKVTYTADKIFLNKQGESLKNKYPTAIIWILVVNIFLSVQLFFGFNNNFPDFKDSITAYTAIGLSLPTLYFIMKNCPISILFNKNAWCYEVIGVKGQNALCIEETKRRVESTNYVPIIYNGRYSGIAKIINMWNRYNVWYMAEMKRRGITSVYTPHSYNFREDIPSSRTNAYHPSVNPSYSSLLCNIHHHNRR